MKSEEPPPRSDSSKNISYDRHSSLSLLNGRIPKRDSMPPAQASLGLFGSGVGGGGVGDVDVAELEKQSASLSDLDDLESDKDRFVLVSPEEAEEEVLEDEAAEVSLSESITLAKPSPKKKTRQRAQSNLPSAPPPPPTASPSPAKLLRGATLKNADGLFSNLRTPSTEEMAQKIERSYERSKREEKVALDQLADNKELIVEQNIKEEEAKGGLRRANQRISTWRSFGDDTSKDVLSEETISYVDQYLAQGAPSKFWPRQGYFRNTYLGGDLRFREEVRQLTKFFRHLMSKWWGFEWSPPLDPPSEAGMSLSANLSHTSVDRPQRVILQVALKGSERYGWRRPALNMMVAVDPTLISDLPSVETKQRELVKLILPVLSRLNEADQVGLSLGRSMISPRSPSLLKEALIEPLKSVISSSTQDELWSEVLRDAGRSLNKRSADPHRAPGAQAILMICGQSCSRHLRQINSAVHQMNLDGTLTSVIEHHRVKREKEAQRPPSTLWQIASTGHGGFWKSEGDEELREKVNQEFDRFSRVVARLLRLSVKLGKDVELIEVIGSEMLNQGQVKRVKAREEAMDQRLSARLGIRSDRGEDDEGVQVIIPAFYGGDSHLIHLALWVKRPGVIAEVNLKYKDMVRAKNASSSQAVSLSGIPRALSNAQYEVREGANSHLIADLSLKMIAEGRPVEELPSAIELKKGVTYISNYTHRDFMAFSRGLLGRPRSEIY